MSIQVKIKKLNPQAKIPSYAHEGDAGLDIHSIEDLTILSNERKLIATGISMALPDGYVSLVWDKSGLAAKNGITVLGGVIDSHYRGEYKIILFNTTKEPFEIKKGDKIAQILIQKVERAIIEEVAELEETSRGFGGFGSTGK